MSKRVDDPSKFGGKVNEFLGMVKEKTGKVIGNKSMEAKGHMQREMGVAEVEAAKRKSSAAKADKLAQKQSLRGDGTTTMPSETTGPSYSNVGQGQGQYEGQGVGTTRGTTGTTQGTSGTTTQGSRVAENVGGYDSSIPTPPPPPQSTEGGTASFRTAKPY